jgi:hypothetical protein
MMAPEKEESISVDELVQLACHKAGVTDFGIMQRTLENVFSVDLSSVTKKSISDKQG